MGELSRGASDEAASTFGCNQVIDTVHSTNVMPLTIEGAENGVTNDGNGSIPSVTQLSQLLDSLVDNHEALDKSEGQT